LDPEAFEEEGTTPLKYQEALTRDTVSHHRGPDTSATLLWNPSHLEKTFDWLQMERQADMASLQGTIMAASGSFPCLTQLILLLICTCI